MHHQQNPKSTGMSERNVVTRFFLWNLIVLEIGFSMFAGSHILLMEIVDELHRKTLLYAD